MSTRPGSGCVGITLVVSEELVAWHEQEVGRRLRKLLRARNGKALPRGLWGGGGNRGPQQLIKGERGGSDADPRLELPRVWRFWTEAGKTRGPWL